MTTIPFIDLQAQRRRLGDRIDAAIAQVMAHGRFIMGPEVADLEARLAARAGRAHAIACANGTDALQLPLMAAGIGPGDAVYVPAFTFAATAEVVALVGATPVFVDVEAESFNIDPQSLAAAIAATRGLTPRAVIPVDLFGQAADYVALAAVAQAHGLLVIEDAAQSFGGTRNDTPCGGFGDVASTSFFPAKPLGCYGDGGAMFTDDDDLAAQLRSLRQHGQGSHKYDQVAVGTNSRLDTLQAAILIEKLAIFDDEIAARDRVAERYTAALADVVTVPRVANAATSVWAQYTIRTKARDAVAAALKAAGIPTAIYYPRALNDQPAFAGGLAPDGVPISRALAGEVLSLPMHPYLDVATQDRIVAAVRAAGGSPRLGPVSDGATPTPPAAERHLMVVVPRLAVGGTERHLLFVLPRLVARGYRVTVCATGAAAVLDGAMRDGGVEVLTGPRDKPRGLDMAGAIARVHWTIRRQRPDLVHFFLPEAYLLGGPVALLAGVRLRLMSRRSLNAYQQQRRLSGPAERWLHRRMTAVLGNSRAICDQLRDEGVPEARLGLIYNGVDTALYRPGDRAAARTALDLPTAALVLVVVANFYHYKGHADLFEALAQAGDRLPDDWVLVLVGRDAGAERTLRQRAARLGIAERIRWTGESGNVVPYLQASDLGLLCSHEEGFPNSVLEGMACGLPMIVTDVGGSPEAVIDGETGHVVPPRDPAALAAALVALGGDPAARQRLGEAGRARVLKSFDLERCVDDYDRLYGRLLAGDNRTIGELLAAP